MDNETHETHETHLSGDAKWLFGLILAAAMPVVGFQWHQSTHVGYLTTSFSDMKKSLDRLTTTVESLMREDVTDLKARVSVLEEKQILPKAEIELEKMDERLRKLETR